MKIPTNIRSIAKLSLSSFQNNFTLHSGNKLGFRSFMSNAEKKFDCSNSQSREFPKDETEIDIENNTNPKDRHKAIFAITDPIVKIATLAAFPQMGTFLGVVSLISVIETTNFFKRKIYDTELSLESLSTIRGLSQGKDITGKIQSENIRQQLDQLFKNLPVFFSVDPQISRFLENGIDPKLMELALLKSKIDSYNLYTVRRLLSKEITIELAGEVGALEYATRMYPHDSKMVELLDAHYIKIKLTTPEMQQTEHSYDKKPLLSIYSKKEVPSRG